MRALIGPLWGGGRGGSEGGLVKDQTFYGFFIIGKQFFNIVQRGGGGIKPMFKNFVANILLF